LVVKTLFSFGSVNTRFGSKENESGFNNLRVISTKIDKFGEFDYPKKG